ncbi:MAG: acetyl-CoA C-acetyltransferase [Deltaproteobacteria bacterium]|nr:MAG: acetyl-CoA C-acetyltransferase [Deltaproteobacteria bacterium]
MMNEVVIAGYLRTAQSKSKPSDPSRDWFHSLRADELLGMLIPGLLEKIGISDEEIDDFIVGSAMGVTEQWTYGGRTPLFLANLSEKIPAKFIDQQCGSSMAAVHMGFMEIATGFADTVLACGMEHMTRVPMGPTLFEKKVISMNPRLYSDAEYRHWDMEVTMNIGYTAEKLASQTTFTREDFDKWGMRSHQLASNAKKEGFFEDEIFPIQAKQSDGSVMRVDSDQAIREQVSMKDMGNLKPAFISDGVITAGNSSPLNAGASAMILMSKDKAKSKQITPLATIRSIGFAGVDPTIMGAGPIPAIQMALEKQDLKVDDIDFWEINEAFSVVVLNCIHQLGIDPEKVNIKGGAIAIGHPLGATGIRLIGTLARILQRENARYGCAAACVGGGQGVATVIER